MIRIQDKKDCCGCSACVQICPKHCIGMKPDEEGFMYPSVDDELCINCGLCEKVCPVINRGEERIPVRTLAVKNNNDETRFKSSSGGAFSALAVRILEEGGVVFGARFNKEWDVVHDHIESVGDLRLFQGSKYVQSVIGDTYALAEAFLKNERKVMFTGTSCQIAGLKKYLRKDYDNLLAIEVICHGVPSPMIWNDYLKYVCADKKVKGISSLNDISGISFRSKLTGWKKYSMVFTGNDGVTMAQTFDKNLFMKGFLNNLYLRPSCYDCPARKGRSGCDISLGDFWGVENSHPDFVDNMGVGLILVYKEKEILQEMNTDCTMAESDYADAVRGNPCIEKSVAEPLGRKMFWDEYGTYGLDAVKRVISRNTPGILKRIVSKIKRVLTIDKV